MLSNFNFLSSFLVHGWKWLRDRKGIGLKNCISDEEDSTDGKWVVRKPAWRSQEADRLMRALQDRLEHTREEEFAHVFQEWKVLHPLDPFPGARFLGQNRNNILHKTNSLEWKKYILSQKNLPGVR